MAKPFTRIIDSSGNVASVRDGCLETASVDYLIAVGEVTGHTAFRCFGNNDAVGASFEAIWPQGGTHTYIGTAAALKISSSSAADTEDITITGLDANWDVQEVTQTLAGQTETTVGTTETWIRVDRMRNVGTSDLVGDVYCYLDDTVTAGVPQTQSKIQLKIPIGFGKSMAARFSVPDDNTAYITDFNCSISAAAAAEIDLMYRPFGNVFYVRRVQHVYFNGEQIHFTFPLECAAKSDIYLRAKANGGAVSGSFSGWCED